jgi:predicted DNA-binding protein with PD1-like motif
VATARASAQMVAGGGRGGAIVVARLAYGDLLLESLTALCRRHRIRNGVIVTGFGSLTDVTVTGVVGPAFPPRRFYRLTRPRGVEVLAMSGVIADYHVHCHVVLCDRRRAFGGHLEPGCRVLSLAEIVLMRVDRINLLRRLDAATGQNLLQRVARYGRGARGAREGSLVAVERRMARRR